MAFQIPERKKESPTRVSTAIHLSPQRIASLQTDRQKDNESNYAAALERKQSIAQAIANMQATLLKIMWGKSENPIEDAASAIAIMNKAEGR